MATGQAYIDSEYESIIMREMPSYKHVARYSIYSIYTILRLRLRPNKENNENNENLFIVSSHSQEVAD